MLPFLDQIIFTVARLDNYVARKMIIKCINEAYSEDMNHNTLINVKTFSLYKKYFGNIRMSHKYDMSILQHIYDSYRKKMEHYDEDIIDFILIKLIINNDFDLFKKIINDNITLFNKPGVTISNNTHKLLTLCVFINNFDLLEFMIKLNPAYHTINTQYTNYLSHRDLLELFIILEEIYINEFESFSSVISTIKILHYYNIQNTLLQTVLKLYTTEVPLLEVFTQFHLLDTEYFNNLLINIAKDNLIIQHSSALHSAILTHNIHAIDFILDNFNNRLYFKIIEYEYPNDKETLNLLEYTMNEIMRRNIFTNSHIIRIYPLIRISSIEIFNIYTKHFPWLKYSTIMNVDFTDDIINDDNQFICTYFVITNIEIMRKIIKLYPYKTHNTKLIELRLENRIHNKNYIKQIFRGDFYCEYIRNSFDISYNKKIHSALDEHQFAK